MEPHGVPSGGDWALQRTAALFFEGTEGCAVDGCVLQRLDGNAVMLSGYNQVPPKPHLPREKTVLMHACAGVAHQHLAQHVPLHRCLRHRNVGLDKRLTPAPARGHWPGRHRGRLPSLHAHRLELHPLPRESDPSATCQGQQAPPTLLDMHVGQSSSGTAFVSKA